LLLNLKGNQRIFNTNTNSSNISDISTITFWRFQLTFEFDCASNISVAATRLAQRRGLAAQGVEDERFAGSHGVGVDNYGFVGDGDGHLAVVALRTLDACITAAGLSGICDEDVLVVLVV
jgi:hypothetical protein